MYASRNAVEPVAQQLDTELEFSLADPAPRQIEHVLVVPGAVEQLRQIGAQLRAGRQRIEESAGQHALDQTRPQR